MPDDPFPPELIAAQRAWTAAEDAVEAFVRDRPGPYAGWSDADKAELDRLRRVLMDATLALRAARAGTPFDNPTDRQRLKREARPAPADGA